MSSKEDILELYVIELQPKCWSICSTLSETKEIDTPRTLCFGSAEVYSNEAIADRHCSNIINGGKFINAKVVPIAFNQEPQLDSGIEEYFNFLYSEPRYAEDGTKIIGGYYVHMLDKLKQVLVNKDKLIYESQKAQMNMKAKLDKIDEILNRKFSISRRLEDIQRELDDSIK